jgi:hypothetical protein
MFPNDPKQRRVVLDIDLHIIFIDIKLRHLAFLA